MLADGSEYIGAYVDPSCRSASCGPSTGRGMELLAQAGADVRPARPCPQPRRQRRCSLRPTSLDVPVWLLAHHGRRRGRRRPHPPRGARRETCSRWRRMSRAVIAVGVNCTAPSAVAASVSGAATIAGKPVVAYPNSGEGWDAAARQWTGSPGISTDARARLGRRGGAADRGAAAGCVPSTSRRSRPPSAEAPFPGKWHLGVGAFFGEMAPRGGWIRPRG